MQRRCSKQSGKALHGWPLRQGKGKVEWLVGGERESKVYNNRHFLCSQRTIIENNNYDATKHGGNAPEKVGVKKRLLARLRHEW